MFFQENMDIKDGAFGSVMFFQENMDIKDRVTTSSKEQLRSLVRV
jgi:hypothetical protein